MIDTGMDALRAVDGLYRAALREGSWEHTVREVCEFLRSSCVCIAWRDDRDGRIRSFSSLGAGGRDRVGVPLQCDVSAERMFDPRITARSMPLEVERAAPAGDGPESTAGEVRIYAWHREQGRCPYCLGAGMRIDERTSAYIGAHWRHVEDVVGGDAGERLSALVGPFVQALRMRSRLGELVGELDAADAALDHLPLGVIFVAADGAITRLNRKAHDMLECRDGMEARAGRLEIDDGEAAVALAEALQHIVAGVDPHGGNSLAAPRGSGRRAFELMLMPARAGGGDSVAVIYVADPEDNPEVDPEALERLFDLTATEARVVALLARGLSPREAAGELGVAVGTVREHVAHVFRKTGVHRQGELLRMVLESPAILAAGEE